MLGAQKSIVFIATELSLQEITVVEDLTLKARQPPARCSAEYYLPEPVPFPHLVLHRTRHHDALPALMSLCRLCIRPVFPLYPGMLDCGELWLTPG